MSEKRKVGKNFDVSKATDIFDKLKNVDGKINNKKQDNKFKNIADMMNEASYQMNKGNLDEAIELYKQVIFILPDSQKAYMALVNIYQKQNDVTNEKEILKKAIINCKNSEGFKKRLDEIR